MAICRKFVAEGVGCGLFAARDICQGEVLLVEEPLVYVLEKPPLPTQCDLCYRSIERKVQCDDCKETAYCSDTCLDIARARFHEFECSASPFGARLSKFKQHVMKSRWFIGMAVCRVLLHILCAFQRSAQEGGDVLRQYLTFCSKPLTDQLQPLERDEVLLEMSVQFRLFLESFPRKVRQQWPSKVRDMVNLRAWIRWAGMWILNNQENGLYIKQSSVNHSCQPNVLAVHSNESTYGLKLIANEAITKGNQLFHCYCPPEYLEDGGEHDQKRREYLWRTYKFHCECARCGNMCLYESQIKRQKVEYNLKDAT